MADNALKTPFSHTLNRNVDNRAGAGDQAQSKGTPCFIKSIEKDMVEVSFEPQNGVWSLPTMKMPQSFSGYSREPTQVGDKGFASPSDYYLGGVSGLGGGNTNFYPKGNLSSLSFQPVSKTGKGSVSRDRDQWTMAGGPNGVMIRHKDEKQQDNNQGGGGSGQPNPFTLIALSRMSLGARYRWLRRAGPLPAARARFRTDPGGGSQDEQEQQPSPEAQMQIDKDGRIIHTSQDTKHEFAVDQKSKKMYLKVPDDGQHHIWIGGPGKKPELYQPMGINTMVKVLQGEED